MDIVRSRFKIDKTGFVWVGGYTIWLVQSLVNLWISLEPFIQDFMIVYLDDIPIYIIS